MTTALPPEVPGHVRHEDHIQNSVRVEGGSNWDFSRSAVATPIAPVLMKVEHPMKEAGGTQVSSHGLDLKYVTTLKFSTASGQLQKAAQNVLNGLPKGGTYHVEARADASERGANAVAQKRAEAVKAFLIKRGLNVDSQMRVSVQKSADNNAKKSNQAVDVLISN